jgi:outer membrane lipopolysaccharide assembly protein LptE/RlpB
MMPMRFLVLCIILFVAGCGYHVAGKSDRWVGGDARTVYVRLFENMTSEPYLDNYMTDAVVAELSRSRLMTLTENNEKADLHLVGKVDSFKSSASAYSGVDRITDYRATMKISVRLLNKRNGKTIWKESLKRTEDYLAAVNKDLQLAGERRAAQLAAQRLAEDIRSSLSNTF